MSATLFGRFRNGVRHAVCWAGIDFTRKPLALLAKPEAELKISADIVAHYCGLANENCFFVQIGANDGITDDSLHSLITQYCWQGILVEPQPDIFEKLKQNYLDQPQLNL